LWRQYVYRGNRHGIGTIRNLLVEFQRAGVRPGLLIVARVSWAGDRGEVQGVGWQLLGGLPRSTREVREILATANSPEPRDVRAEDPERGNLRDQGPGAALEGRARGRDLHERGARNGRSSGAGSGVGLHRQGAPDALREGKTWSEGKLHAAIEEVVGGWAEFVKVRVRRSGATPRIGWSLQDRAVRAAARRDGKYVRLCTDPRLSAAGVLEQYLGKDFVEKALRTLRTGIEVEPVRHGRERRVLAHPCVSGLAYRLEVALR